MLRLGIDRDLDWRTSLIEAIGEQPVQITRNTMETRPGPGDWFTGTVDDEGNPATWGDHVTAEEYAAAPSIESEN